jgi:acyl carrier protein
MQEELASQLARVPREFTAENARRWTVAYLAYLHAQPQEKIDLFRPLADYGLDSVDAVLMTGELEEHFGIELDPALFLRKATLGEILAWTFSSRDAPA